MLSNRYTVGALPIGLTRLLFRFHRRESSDTEKLLDLGNDWRFSLRNRINSQTQSKQERWTGLR